MKKRVLLGMSGGIDSTVSAMLLLEQGYEVVGVTFRTYDSIKESCIAKEKGCCTIDSIMEAKHNAERMGFDHHIVDFRDTFRRCVIQNFMDEYMAGHTPNPCVLCNSHIKWGELMRTADEFGCDFIATGHYARIAERDGHVYLRTAADTKKDQTYFLWMLTSMAPANAKAIRDALIDFKQSGKWIIASAKSYGQTNYYVISVADRICLDPTGAVDWNGLSATKMYYTRVMEKIGVEMQILKVGTFKSAVEPFFRTSMSDADRMQTMQYIGGIWDEYKSAVAASRKLSVEELDALADRYMGLQTAEDNLAAGLVDTIVYCQDMDSLLRVYAGTKDYHLLKTAKLANVKRVESKAKDKVAVLYLEGQIYDDGNEGIVGKNVIKTIKKIQKDDQVKALVLRVNSPGG